MSGPRLEPVFLALGGPGGDVDHETARQHLAKVCGSPFIVPLHILDRDTAVVVSRAHAQLWTGSHPALAPFCNDILKSARAKKNEAFWQDIRTSGLTTLALSQLGTMTSTLWQFVGVEGGKSADQASLGALSSLSLRLKRIGAINFPADRAASLTGCLQPATRIAEGVDLAGLVQWPGEVSVAICSSEPEAALPVLTAIREAMPARTKLRIALLSKDEEHAHSAKARIIEAEKRRKPKSVIDIVQGDDLRPALASEWDFFIGGPDFAPKSFLFKAIRCRFMVLPARRLVGRLSWHSQTVREPLRLAAAGPDAIPDRCWYLNEAMPGAFLDIVPTDFRNNILAVAVADDDDLIATLAAGCHELLALSSRTSLVRWIYSAAKTLIPKIAEADFRAFFQIYSIKGRASSLSLDTGLHVSRSIALLDWLHECPVAELREQAYQRFLGRGYDGTDRSMLTDAFPMADRVKYLRNIAQSKSCAAHFGPWEHHCLVQSLSRLSAYMDKRALYDDAKIGRYIKYKNIQNIDGFANDITVDDLIIASCRRYLD